MKSLIKSTHTGISLQNMLEYNFITFERFKDNKKEAFASNFINGTPKQIRIAVYTVKGCCPRPLDDGGPTDISYSTKSIFTVKRFMLVSLIY